ncbi:hypothetical protein AB0K51_28880 [Kitasatospora sp. NPDC049285]|uniref:hypothetical protein n=1 Tax=Kitasatospora sp. NPDC049285 TaxID=3157096 RepID=UPI003444EA2B
MKTVRVMACEVRRLRGVRSTWVLLVAALLVDAAVAAVLARQAPAEELTISQALRSVAAVVPVLPLPVAALASAALGALCYGHELRWPGLAASRVTFGRRLRALAAKAAVVGVMSALLAVVTLVVDALVVRLALPAGVSAAPLLDPAGLSAALERGGIGRPLLGFLGLVVVSGWVGLLATSLVRSATAGFLLTCALPAALEPTAGLVLHRAGRDWPLWGRELMPFQYGLNWVRGTAGRAAAALDGVVIAAVLVPAVLLVLAAVLAQLRRRSL